MDFVAELILSLTIRLYAYCQKNHPYSMWMYWQQYIQPNQKDYFHIHCSCIKNKRQLHIVLKKLNFCI